MTFLAALSKGHHGGVDSLLDAALEVDRVGASGDVLETVAEDRLGQHGRRGGAVAGCVTGLAGDLAHHLGAHVLVGILEIDFLGHSHTVLGDGRRTEFLVENHVAALGSEGHLDRLGQGANALEQRLACALVELKLFC